jgi:hypothetical protein
LDAHEKSFRQQKWAAARRDSGAAGMVQRKQRAVFVCAMAAAMIERWGKKSVKKMKAGKRPAQK